MTLSSLIRGAPGPATSQSWTPPRAAPGCELAASAAAPRLGRPAPVPTPAPAHAAGCSGRNPPASSTARASSSTHRHAVRTCALPGNTGAGTTTPYRWSWSVEDDAAAGPGAVCELGAAELAAAASLQDLTRLLHAAADGAAPRATLTPGARAALLQAVQRVLRAGASSSGPAVGEVAALLEAYGRLTQELTAIAPAATAPAAAAAAAAGPHTPSTSAPAAAGAEAAAAGGSVVGLLLQPLLGGAAGTGGGSGTRLEGCSTRELADLMWALSELPESELPWEGAAASGAPAAAAAATAAGPPAAAGAGSEPAAPAALQRAVLARVRGQDFLAPDLCRAVCALGSLAPQRGGADGKQLVGGFALDGDMLSALNDEVRYQLSEFESDFSAGDMSRLISGLAGLRLGGKVAADEEYRRVLMKAVYGKTRSITEKAGVDFALSNLLEGDPEARSMHYDTRWTHEELHWLPRRERDKRRIMKEGWYRTQWGGWAPGGRA